MTTPAGGYKFVWFRGEPGGRSRAQEEFLELAQDGQARLLAAIERVCQGTARPDAVKSLGNGIYEIRVQCGTNPFRIFFMYWGTTHIVALTAVYKNQRRLPRAKKRATDRRTTWLANHGNEPN